MAPTISQVTAFLLARAKGRMEAAGLSTVTTENPDMIDPISTALREMGVEVDLDNVTDDDLAELEDSQVGEFLERVHLALLRNVYGNLTLTDIQVGDRRESLSQLAERVKADIDALSEAYPSEEQAADNSLTPGTLNFDWMSKSTDWPTII